MNNIEGNAVKTRLLPPARGLVALALGFCLPSWVQAIPPLQFDFDDAFAVTTSATLSPVPDSEVTVDNGDNAAFCVVQFSANVSATPFDEVSLGYAVDARPCTLELQGPDRFYVSEGSSLDDTRTAVHVIPLNVGIHTIRPCFRIFDIGRNGAQVFLGSRTLTVECRSR
jgi:hypothetical protein